MEVKTPSTRSVIDAGENRGMRWESKRHVGDGLLEEDRFRGEPSMVGVFVLAPVATR
jgi:hypothetical protein